MSSIFRYQYIMGIKSIQLISSQGRAFANVEGIKLSIIII